MAKEQESSSTKITFNFDFKTYWLGWPQGQKFNWSSWFWACFEGREYEDKPSTSNYTLRKVEDWNSRLPHATWRNNFDLRGCFTLIGFAEPVTRSSSRNLLELCQELLGDIPPENSFACNQIKLTCLNTRFRELPT